MKILKIDFQNFLYRESTVADLVVPVPVRSGSVSKIIGRHLKLSADIYKSNSVSFELHNCRPAVTKLKTELNLS